MYSRINNEGLDGYFGILGMILTDGVLYNNYVGIFERHELDVSEDEDIIKVLMNEMATGEIWKGVNKKLAVMVSKRLEEKGYNGGKPRAEDEEPPNAVYHVASGIEESLLSEGRRWRKVMETLLKKCGVMRKIAKGSYNKELFRIISKDKELEDVLYSCALSRRDMLDDMVSKNKVLAREIVTNVIEQGYWLYMDVLGGVMKARKMRRLFYEDDVFKKIRAKYGTGGERLSMRRLRVLAREGSLERRLVMIFKDRFDELLRSGELDTLLKERTEDLIRRWQMNILEKLVKIFKDKFDELLSSGQLGTMFRGEVLHLTKYREFGVVNLKKLMGIWAVNRRVFGGLLSSEECSTTFKGIRL